MGIIKAIKETVGGSLADQWLEVVEPEDMGDQTVMTRGICTGKGANKKAQEIRFPMVLSSMCMKVSL